MFTNKLDELKQLGFSIKKTRDVQTVVEHKELFYVRGSAGEIKAPFNEDTGTYMVTISGYPSNNQLSEAFKRPYLPFLSMINEEVANREHQQVEQAAQQNMPKLVATQFSKLEEGANFFKQFDENSTSFIKIDEMSYRRADETIGSALELYAKESDEVFVIEMMDDISVLTPEQKQDIVDHTPKGLDHDEFSAHVADEIDNIAGLELLSDEELSDLIDELYTLYMR